MSAVSLRDLTPLDVLFQQKEILFVSRLIFVCRVPSQSDGMNIHLDIDVYKTIAKVVFYFSKMTISERYNLRLMKPDIEARITEKQSFWACVDSKIRLRPNLTENELASCLKIEDKQVCFPKGCQVEYVEKIPNSLKIQEDEKNLLMTGIKKHISRFFLPKISE